MLADDKANYEATVMGWVRSFRNNQFIALNDGRRYRNGAGAACRTPH